MAFRETVRAETLDLVETVFCKLRVVTTRDHVVDHLGFELSDRADIAESRHGAAQAVGFLGSELRGLDRDPHRLLLEQRHAERLVQDLSQFVLVAMRGRWRGVDLLFLAVAPAKIGMHHVALDRAWPYNGHLDDEVVEFP